MGDIEDLRVNADDVRVLRELPVQVPPHHRPLGQLPPGAGGPLRPPTLYHAGTSCFGEKRTHALPRYGTVSEPRSFCSGNV